MQRFATILFLAFLATARPALAAPPNILGAEGLGLISPGQSAQWTAQAQRAAGTVVNVQPFRSTEVLRGYKSVGDTRQVFSTIPLSESERQALVAHIGKQLEASKSVKFAELRGAQAALYSSLSYRREGDGRAIVEVLVVLTDISETDAKMKQGMPVLSAMAKSSVWASSVRKSYEWDAISSNDAAVYSKIEKDVFTMYATGMENLLLSF